MKVYTINEADTSTDMDIKLTAVRASRYRIFGSGERIPIGELAVADLRDNIRPDDFEEQFQILDRHPMAAIMLVRCLK
jgi:hypothetical protein